MTHFFHLKPLADPSLILCTELGDLIILKKVPFEGVAISLTLFLPCVIHWRDLLFWRLTQKHFHSHPGVLVPEALTEVWLHQGFPCVPTTWAQTW